MNLVFLNRLISILKAQDIPVSISSVKVENPVAKRILTLVFIMPNLFLFYLVFKARCSLVKLSVILGCSTLSVYKSNQENLFDQADCGRILFFKMILSDFESFMKVLVLYV
jgi:hypothetical protein